MVDNFTLFSTMFESTGQEAVWLEHLWNAAGGLQEDNKFVCFSYELFGDQEAFLCNLRLNAVEAGKPVQVILTCDENCCLEDVAKVLKCFLKHFERKDSIIISYAETCSKMRIDQFGGGIVLVTAEEYRIRDGHDLLEFVQKEVSREIQSDPH